MQRDLFDVIGHTADLAIIVRGRDLASLLTNAAGALYSLAINGVVHDSTDLRMLSIDSVDDEALLVDWLNELIYLLYVERLAFSRFRFDRLSGGSVSAACFGPHLRQDTRFRRDIKAATYHMNRITQDAGFLSARIIFDV